MKGMRKVYMFLATLLALTVISIVYLYMMWDLKKEPDIEWIFLSISGLAGATKWANTKEYEAKNPPHQDDTHP